jgi:hypothetical protein
MRFDLVSMWDLCFAARSVMNRWPIFVEKVFAAISGSGDID